MTPRSLGQVNEIYLFNLQDSKCRIHMGPRDKQEKNVLTVNVLAQMLFSSISEPPTYIPFPNMLNFSELCSATFPVDLAADLFPIIPRCA